LTVVVPPTLRPCRYGDALVFGLASGIFLVQAGVGFGLELLEIGAALEWSFFDDDDVQAGLGQQLRRDAGPGSGPDDRNVTAEALRQGAMLAAKDFPSPLQALKNGVGDVAHGVGSGERKGGHGHTAVGPG
jgi:hypothetical protein